MKMTVFAPLGCVALLAACASEPSVPIYAQDTYDPSSSPTLETLETEDNCLRDDVEGFDEAMCDLGGDL